MDKAEILFKRRNKKLKDKYEIWKLVYQAYKGGLDFINSENLVQWRLEDNQRYKDRLKRADYTNHTQQLIDMLIGFIYAKPVKREIEDKYSYIFDSIYKNKSIDSLMNTVSTNCLKSTVGILVDSPEINDDLSEADRTKNGLNPYCVFYEPFQICDYEIDDKGELIWILLDNSYIDSSDPYTEPQEIRIKRLWTRNYYQDVQEFKDNNNETIYDIGDEINHNLGIVPFIFVNAKDIDDDYITDSPFEDIALKSRTIFNISSWCDETLAGTAFQVLFMPYETQQDMEVISNLFSMQKGGVGDLACIPFKAGSQPPTFGGTVVDIEKYMNRIKHHTDEILLKFGIKSESKGYWNESGVAKSIDFSKTESFLKSVSLQLEETEKRIIYLCSLWEGKEIKATIEYSRDYEKPDIQSELNKLMMLFTFPSDEIKMKAYIEAVNLLFPKLTADEIDVMKKELTESFNSTL